MAVHKGQG